MSITITSTPRLDELGGALEVSRRWRRSPRRRAAGRARRAWRTAAAPGVNVLGRDQADQRAVCVDERQLLDLALDHQPLGGLERQLALRRRPARRPASCATPPCLRACRRTGRRARSAGPSAAALVIDDDERAGARPPHQRDGVGERRLGRDRVRIADDDVLHPLDLFDLAHLRLDVAVAEAAVDDADARLPRPARSPSARA